jgi:MraZ protein
VALFVGEFDVMVDGKHRLAIPAALREQMVPAVDGKNFYLVLGPDKHLCLYPDLYYRQLLGPLQRSPLPSRASRRYDLLFAMTRVLKPDSQGRVVLPEKSMQRAILSSAVTLVGKGDHIEIWPAEEWEKYVEEALPRYGEDVLDAGDGFASASEPDK